MEDTFMEWTTTNIIEKLKSPDSPCHVLPGFKPQKLKLFGSDILREYIMDLMKIQIASDSLWHMVSVSCCITFVRTRISQLLLCQNKSPVLQLTHGHLLTGSRHKIEKEHFIINWTFTETLNSTVRVRKEGNGWEGMGLGRSEARGMH